MARGFWRVPSDGSFHGRIGGSGGSWLSRESRPPHYILSDRGRTGGSRSELGGTKENREERIEERRAAGCGLLFRLLESRLVSEAGGQSEADFHGRPGRRPTNPAAKRRKHATSRVDENLLSASRVAVCFPPWKPFYATFPALSRSPRARSPVCPSLRTIPARACVGACDRCSLLFSFFPLSPASMEREPPTAAHLFALIAGHR